MDSPKTRAQIHLGIITGHLWAGKRDDAFRVVANLISVSRAGDYQRKANGAGYEMEIDSVLSQAFSEKPLGASDQTFTYDQERRWLGRARRLALKHQMPVVRKWQNRLIFDASVERGLVVGLATMVASWIVDEIEARFVHQVEDTAITLVEEEREWGTYGTTWHLYLDDGREVTPHGRPKFTSFLDALFVATEIKRGTPSAHLSKRPLLWGTL
jgi:hypothetical protein